MSTEQRSPESETQADAELSALLEALPTGDLDNRRATHLKAAARAAFIAEHQPAEKDSWANLATLYRRAFEPALVATACAAYLGWACQIVLTLQP